MCLCVLFFFKQKTAYEMRISDWSSDVCSSDLVDDAAKAIVARYVVAAEERAVGHVAPRRGDAPLRIELKFSAALEIGADALVAVGRRRSQRIEPDTRAVGHIGAELEGAELRQLAVTAFEHRRHVGVNVRCDRRVPVGRDSSEEHT